MVRKASKMELEGVQGDVGSASLDNVFSSLFGSGNATTSSIFTDENPFKRKPDNHNVASGCQFDRLEDGAEVQKVKKKSSEVNDDTVEFGIGTKRMKTGLSTLMENDMENAERNDEKNDGKKKKRKRGEVAKELERLKLVEKEKEAEVVDAAAVVGMKRKNADRENVENMLSKDEGFDDEDKLLRTVFVGNLPLKMKKKLLLKEFAKFGEIESIRFRSVPLIDTKIPRKGAVLLKKINDSADNVHAYVVFKSQNSAEDALSHNMAVIEGHHVRVDRACPPRKKLKGGEYPLYDIKRTLFLGNLPFDVKDEEIYQLFYSIKELESSVEGVRVVRDSHGGIGKGYAYLLLKTEEAAKLAVKKRNLTIRGRELRVFPAKQNSTPSKRKQTFSSDKGSSVSKKQASSVSVTAPERSRELKSRGVMAYQGLRGNKADSTRKPTTRKGSVRAKSVARERTERKEKRPAVAARKVRSQVGKEFGTSKHDRKRKLDSRTPDSHVQKKGAKIFRKC